MCRWRADRWATGVRTSSGTVARAESRRLAPVGDAGAGTVEYLGGIMFAGLLLLSLIMVATPVGGTIAAKLCEAVGTTCGGGAISAEESAEKAPPARACTVRTDGEHGEYGVSISFVDLGSEGNMSVERMSDGTVKVTVGREGSLGASLSAGEAKGSVHVGDYGVDVGVSASVSAAAFAGGGTEFVFADQAGADAFTDYVHRQLVKDGVKTVSGGGSNMAVGVGVEAANWLFNKATGYDYRPPAPNASYFEAGVAVKGDAVAGSYLATSGASAEASQAIGFRVDHETGDRTVDSRVELSAEAELQLGLSSSDASWGQGANGNGNAELVVATTIDADGEITHVSLDGAATAEGAYALTDTMTGYPLQGSGGRGVQTSAQFDVTDANRERVTGALAGIGILSAATRQVPLAQVQAIPLILSEARSSGDITAQFVDVSTSNLVDVAVGIKAPAVGGIGLSGGASTSSSESIDARYLGDNGWKEWIACTS